MADATFQLEIVTPERAVFSGAVTSLVAPGLEGYFGVLARHAPLVAALKEGTVVVDSFGPGEPYEIPIGGGFFECNNNRAIILADSAEPPPELVEEEFDLSLPE